MANWVSADMSFWIVQGLCLVGAAIMVMRMQQSERRQFDLYHSYMCLPMIAVFAIQGAWVMFYLCVVGAVRTFLLATDWGWTRRNLVVGVCLAIAVALAASSASTFFDWFLVTTTIWCVGSEAFKNFLNLRASTLINCIAWGASSFLCGAYVNVLSNAFAIASNAIATERDFKLTARFKASVFGCEKSRAAYLAVRV